MIYLIDYNNQGHRQTYGKLYEENIINSKYIIINRFSEYLKILFTKNNVYFLTGDDNFIITFFIGLFRSVFNKKTFMNYYHLDFYVKKDIKSKIKKFLINRKYKNIISFHFNEFKIDELKESNFIYIPEFFFGFNFKEKVKNEKYTFFYGGAISKRKGIYKLIDAFYEFSLNNGTEFVLKIVGKMNLKEKEIIDKYNYMVKQGIIIHLNKRLDDKEFDYEIYSSDCVIIPYEKNFTSNSGVLAKAIFYNKNILASDHGYIGKFLQKYKIGCVINIDNQKEFIQAIKKTIDIYVSMNEFDKLKKKHNRDTVFNKINSILKGDNEW